MKFIFQIIFLMFITTSCNLQDTDKRPEEIKQKSIEELVVLFEDCKLNSTSNFDCKHFIAQAICEYNAINDFKDESGNYVEYHSIYDMISIDERWKKIGEATDQSVLIDAQTLANDNLPVIAINTSDKHKLSVLITKGEVSTSRSWNLKTPNSTAFFPISGPKSYTNKPLSYSWSNPKGIYLYVRK